MTQFTSKPAQVTAARLTAVRDGNAEFNTNPPWLQAALDTALGGTAGLAAHVGVHVVQFTGLPGQSVVVRVGDWAVMTADGLRAMTDEDFRARYQ